METVIIYEGIYDNLVFENIHDLRSDLSEEMNDYDIDEVIASDYVHEAENVSGDIYTAEVSRNQGYGRYKTVHLYFRVPEDSFEAKFLGEYDHQLSAEEIKEFNQ